MPKKKILCVLGTRPEAIKLAPLIAQLKKQPERFDCVVASTGQHRQMLDQVLELFDLRPDHDLDMMQTGQSLHHVLSRCVAELGPLIEREAPDLVLTQGDTTTAFAASLAAFYQETPVGHVEAGLRTGNLRSPYPEELNRRLTATIADLHFAPTEAARANLLAEGVSEGAVFVTGNTVVDALHWVRARVGAAGACYAKKAGLEIGDRKLVLVTGHRRENFGDGFRAVCEGLRTLAERNPEILIVYPVHLNPRVREPVGEILGGTPNIETIEPVDYATFVYLMEKSHFIISDSGGVQEEAPSLGRPVLVTRDVTERQEAVAAGAVKLVGTDSAKLLSEAEKLLRDSDAYRAMVPNANPFGDGRASERIVEIVSAYLAAG